ncbi:hypothetical protein [Georgenia sp.]
MDTAFDHLAAYGLLMIMESVDPGRVRIRWTDSLTPRLKLTGADWPEAAESVHAHARHHSGPTSWVQLNGQGTSAGLFSPRVGQMDPAGVRRWYEQRHRALDAVSGDWANLDRAMIGALGEPSYWSDEGNGPRPDHGANRWEMKTRNRGEDVVAHRLRKLASHLEARTPQQVKDGLRGRTVVDEDGKGSAMSRTPTGLMPPGPTDTARAWCALWGISVLPVIHRGTGALPTKHRASGASKSAGHLGHHSQGYLFLPVMTQAWPAVRLSRVLTSVHLATAATSGLEADDGGVTDPTDLGPAWHWLRARGTGAVVRFPVYRSPNKSAPEKWAQKGRLLFPRTIERE